MDPPRPRMDPQKYQTVIAAAWLMLSTAVSSAAADDAPPGEQTSHSDVRQPATSEAAPDKSRFNLFNPTPPDLMRDFQTDRPDLTEGPFTVDAGHWQLEMDIANYTYDRVMPDHIRGRFQQLILFDPTIKVGLLDNLDLELIGTPFQWERFDDFDSGRQTSRSGIGDTLLRLKLNLWGNEGGDTAFALLPYVKLPTSQHGLGNHFVEGGMIFPLVFKLPAGFELDLMTEFDIFHNSAGGGYHLNWTNSLALHRDLIKDRLNGYVEFFSSVSREPRTGPLETADVGLLYLLAPNVQLDAGINFGLTRRAPDYNPFVGISFRF